MRSFTRLTAMLSLLCGLLLPLAVHEATAKVERRVALVLGNAAYTVAPALVNPTIDAKAVAAAFQQLGFEVIEGFDLTGRQMRAKIAEFSSAIPGSQAAVVYFAGHGVSVDEENYLLPTDLALKSPTDLDLDAISLSLLLKQMKREERVNVVILDACRDNPFAAELNRSATRALISDRGLSRVENDLAKGTLIAFASDPKSTALDGKPGEHSPFTKALLGHLEDAGVSIGTVMDRVRAQVWQETKNKQLPWVSTSIIGEFVLNPHVAPAAPREVEASLEQGAASPVALAAAASRADLEGDRMAQETRLWDSAERGNTIDEYKAYLDAYPKGAYARMAKTRIAKLGAGSTTPPAQGTNTDPSDGALEAEIGTRETERSLALTLAKRKEVQQRLAALDYEPGKISGDFDEKTRSAIMDWQKRHEIRPTGWLAPLQYAALRAESELALRRFLARKAPAPKPERVASGRSVATPAKVVQRPVASRVQRVRESDPNAQPGRYPGYATSQPGGTYGGTPRPYSGGYPGQYPGAHNPGAAAFIGGVVGGAFGGLFGRHH
jgi:uncharacterized caspase-like protein